MQHLEYTNLKAKRDERRESGELRVGARNREFRENREYRKYREYREFREFSDALKVFCANFDGI